MFDYQLVPVVERVKLVVDAVDVLYLVVQDVALPEQLEAVAAQMLHVLLNNDAHQLAEQYELRTNASISTYRMSASAAGQQSRLNLRTRARIAVNCLP